MPNYDEDTSDASQFCRHGTFIGSWWGPDYLCGYCESGITDSEFIEASRYKEVARFRRAINANMAVMWQKVVMRPEAISCRRPAVMVRTVPMQLDSLHELEQLQERYRHAVARYIVPVPEDIDLLDYDWSEEHFTWTKKEDHEHAHAG